MKKLANEILKDHYQKVLVFLLLCTILFNTISSACYSRDIPIYPFLLFTYIKISQMGYYFYLYTFLNPLIIWVIIIILIRGKKLFWFRLILKYYLAYWSFNLLIYILTWNRWGMLEVSIGIFIWFIYDIINIYRHNIIDMISAFKKWF